MIIPILLSAKLVNCFTPTTLALLHTIAFAEGTNHSYTTHFTGVQSPIPPSGHPNKAYCAGELCSTAYGRYQFLSTVWDTLADRHGYTDMRPANQDRAAIELMREKTDLVCNKVEDRYTFEFVITKLSTIWASFPGSPYGQPTKKMDVLWNFYSNTLLNIYIYNTK